MNKKANQKNIVYIGILLFIIAIAGLIYILFFNKQDAIIFNEDYLSIEYGETFDYSKAIEKTDSEKLEIIYPDIEVKEVGIYHLTFKYKKDDKEKTQEQEFIVKDTKLPKATLNNKKTIEVNVNSQYDIFSNVKAYKNLGEDAQQNRQQVNNQEYKKLKKEIEKQNKLINERIITKKDDIKDSKINKNCILYVTDFDSSKEGTYQVKILLVDENYNIDEKTWKVKVVPAGQLVNSGGTVTCSYANDELQNNDAYVIDYSEIYSYNENMIVSTINFSTQMTFNESYDTDENINELVNAIHNKYNGYMDNKGVNVNVEANSKTVTTNIVIDFNLYDIKNDPLNILENKNSGKVNINTVIKQLKDKAVCEIH